MSQENVELMREFVEAWERDDVETMEALFQGRVGPNFEFHPLYLDRAYKGAEVRQMWADITGTWEDYRSEVEEILDLGEHVLTVARITGRGASGGVPIPSARARRGRVTPGSTLSGRFLRWLPEAVSICGVAPPAGPHSSSGTRHRSSRDCWSGASSP